ncbi:GNAT family N-acetyltransferase [Ruminococcus sp. 5_1_39BFAA]|uniref:GNAT family N-acetyltransferase n=1 Tax=Ruminococcus sp. 5_1_39BFAA TaxID=457412 RepID=UPI00356298A8
MSKRFLKVERTRIMADLLRGRRKMILETERLYLREMNQSDYEALSRMLQDEDVMYAYNGAFNDEETQEWLDR